eukprot:XP_001707860.1 Hypothetical protein GL50803_5112 [Giardia lamblia ATCC 50803]
MNTMNPTLINRTMTDIVISTRSICVLHDIYFGSPRKLEGRIP